MVCPEGTHTLFTQSSVAKQSDFLVHWQTAPGSQGVVPSDELASSQAPMLTMTVSHTPKTDALPRPIVDKNFTGISSMFKKSGLFLTPLCDRFHVRTFEK